LTALRRFQRIALVTIAATFVGIAAVNTTVDPWRVLDVPWSSARLDAYRDIETVWSRTGKTGLARHGRWDGAMFGTSRVGSSLRPDHPAFGDRRIVNLGLDGGPLWVSHALFRDFLDHQSPRFVLFSIDLQMLYGTRNADPADYLQSPLNPDGDRFERELRYVAGFSTFVASVETLFRWALGRRPLHSTSGQRRWNGPENRARAIETFVRTGAHRARELGAAPELDPDAEALVEDVIARSQAAGARLVLIVPPDHCALHVVMHETGPRDFFFRNARRFLVSAVERANRAHPEAPPVEYWDFADLSPINCERLPVPPANERMQNWFDLVHIAPTPADLILDRVMGVGSGGAAGYGTRLDSGNVDAYLARLPHDLARHMRERPEEVAFVRQLLDLPEDASAP
jgi:hypothetical protein